MDTLKLEIAGFIFNIKFSRAENNFYRDEWISTVNRLFSGFIVSASRTADFVINFTERSCYPIITKEKKDKFILFSSRISKTEYRTYYASGYAQFESIIMDTLFFLLAKNGGFALHSSSIINSDKADIFLAPSGGGKSTIVRNLTGKFVPYTDDITLIKKSGSGYFAFQAPYHGKNPVIKRVKEGYPVGNVYVLRKAASFNLEKFNKEAFNLFGQLVTDKANKKELIGNYLKFSEQINIKVLSFSRGKREMEKNYK